MGDWAEEAYLRLREREGQAHAENQRVALERHQVLSDAPLIWEQLLDEIAEEVSDFGEKRPGYLTVLDDRYDANPNMSVSGDAKRLQIGFYKDVPRITYQVSQSQGPREKALQVVKGEFTFRVSDQEVWLYSNTTSRMTVSDVLEELLNHLV